MRRIETVSSSDQSRRPDEAETAPRQLTPEAQRALAEAEERRRRQQAETEKRAKELGGRAGPDPVRYGDWENGGIVSDF